MSWNEYITKLKEPEGDAVIRDAAIVGIEPASVWASTPNMANITAAEIKVLTSSDKSKLYSTGVTIAGMRCTLIRDQFADEPFTMDIKTKATPTDSSTYNITVAKSKQTLVIVMGAKDVHGGEPNKRAYNMADYLRKSNY
ncbi:profilin-1 [Myripristis murdjan]|uniref:Profilin n=1 Tax=Myripristis murdjan TaxID=586833 RepID=A0A667ZK66_9TELE|nr:profilin-1-like [Myripristis murdjan]